MITRTSLHHLKQKKIKGDFSCFSEIKIDLCLLVAPNLQVQRLKVRQLAGPVLLRPGWLLMLISFLCSHKPHLVILKLDPGLMKTQSCVLISPVPFTYQLVFLPNVLLSSHSFITHLSNVHLISNTAPAWGRLPFSIPWFQLALYLSVETEEAAPNLAQREQASAQWGHLSWFTRILFFLLQKTETKKKKNLLNESAIFLPNKLFTVFERSTLIGQAIIQEI